MATPSNDGAQGFKLYRKTDVVDLYYWKDNYEDVDSIVFAIKQSIDQGTTINLTELMESEGTYYKDARHRKIESSSDGLDRIYADIQRKRQSEWDF